MPPIGNGDFLAAHWEGRLSCRPPGGAAFLPPTGRGDYLVAHREGRLSCRPPGGAAFLPPTGRGGFLAACSSGRDIPVPHSSIRPVERRYAEWGLRPPKTPLSATRKSPLHGDMKIAAPYSYRAVLCFLRSGPGLGVKSIGPGRRRPWIISFVLCHRPPSYWIWERGQGVFPMPRPRLGSWRWTWIFPTPRKVLGPGFWEIRVRFLSERKPSTWWFATIRWSTFRTAGRPFGKSIAYSGRGALSGWPFPTAAVWTIGCIAISFSEEAMSTAFLSPAWWRRSRPELVFGPVLARSSSPGSSI